MRYYDFDSIFTDDVLIYCENHGIYEVYSRRENTITYYSLYSEGIYKVTKNIKSGKETRKLLRYKDFKHLPKYLYGENGGSKYNYMCG